MRKKATRTPSESYAPQAQARRVVPADHQRWLASLHKKFHAMWVDVVLARVSEFD